MSGPGAALRDLLEARRGVVIPGAFNAMSARLIVDLGFPAVYVSGAGVTNMSLGLPDQGFMGLAEIAEHTSRIRDAVDVPLIVDADTGFGNALNVRHTVRVLERAGADCIQFEDQVSPKRCGHFDGKSVISQAEAVAKLHAAVEARGSDDLLIMARTDAAAVEGFDGAVERARAYAEAGADVLFVEAITDRDQVLALPGLIDRPLVANLVIGGKTPIVSAAELAEAGYGMVLYANAALQGAVLGMQNALGALRDRGAVTEEEGLVAPFAERQRLVDKPTWDELDARYSS